jgi:hypothetical protein
MIAEDAMTRRVRWRRMVVHFDAAGLDPAFEVEMS